MKILEQNGTEVTNIDQAAINSIYSIGDGVIRGRFNNLTIAIQDSSTLLINKGHIIISGFNVIVEEPVNVKVIATTTLTKEYLIGILDLVDNNPYFSFAVTDETRLDKYNLFKENLNTGFYKMLLASFNVDSNGISNESLKVEFNYLEPIGDKIFQYRHKVTLTIGGANEFSGEYHFEFTDINPNPITEYKDILRYTEVPTYFIATNSNNMLDVIRFEYKFTFHRPRPIISNRILYRVLQEGVIVSKNESLIGVESTIVDEVIKIN